MSTNKDKTEWLYIKDDVFYISDKPLNIEHLKEITREEYSDLYWNCSKYIEEEYKDGKLISIYIDEDLHDIMKPPTKRCYIVLKDKEFFFICNGNIYIDNEKYKFKEVEHNQLSIEEIVHSDLYKITLNYHYQWEEK